jgi:hypothetical protein
MCTRQTTEIHGESTSNPEGEQCGPVLARAGEPLINRAHLLKQRWLDGSPTTKTCRPICAGYNLKVRLQVNGQLIGDHRRAIESFDGDPENDEPP